MTRTEKEKRLTGANTLETPSREAVEVFKRLGLTKYETTIILALVANQDSPMDYKGILSETRVPYGRIHTTLVSLEQKGLIECLGGRPKQYSPKPIGQMLEDYILTPVISVLADRPSAIDRHLSDLWIGQVTGKIPVVRLDDDGGSPDIDFINGVENTRKREFAETLAGKKHIRFCAPSSGFLNRRRNLLPRTGENVRIEIITSLSPKQFAAYFTSEERKYWRESLKRHKGDTRTEYYYMAHITERMLIVDDRFASLGGPAVPVRLHIYSRSICNKLIDRFEKLKADAQRIDFREGSYS